MTTISPYYTESHALNVHVAIECGVNSALLFNHVHFWIKENKIKGKNYRKGKTWMFQTYKEMAEHFPYLSEKQVRTAMHKLIFEGYIVIDCFNKAKYDKTNWYSLKEPQKTSYDLEVLSIDPSRADRRASEVLTIPYNKKDNKKDNAGKVNFGHEFLIDKQEVGMSSHMSEIDNDDFAIWWAAYPRQIERRKAYIEYRKARQLTDAGNLLNAAESYAREVAGVDTPFRKKPDNWLREQKWLEYQPTADNFYNINNSIVSLTAEEAADFPNAVKVKGDDNGNQ